METVIFLDIVSSKIVTVCFAIVIAAAKNFVLHNKVVATPTFSTVAAEKSRWSTPTPDGTALLTTVVRRSRPSFKGEFRSKWSFTLRWHFLHSSPFPGRFAANGYTVEANSGSALKKKKKIQKSHYRDRCPVRPETATLATNDASKREATFRPATSGWTNVLFFCTDMSGENTNPGHLGVF